MQIEHIGVWVKDLEEMRAFYETYFSGVAGGKYTNEKKQFQSYFLTFDSGARLELMHTVDLTGKRANALGYAHLAMRVETKEDLHALVDRLVEAGYALLNGPRTTGDGYYEAVIEDPEGNWIEITI